MEQTEATVTENQVIGPGCHILRCACPAIADEAAPGQYLHVRACRTNDPLLRRPISIMTADPHRGSVQVLVMAVGCGTEMIVSKGPGDPLDIVGPLGNGFSLDAAAERPLLIGGSFGVSPLVFLAQRFAARGRAERIRGLLGAKTAPELFARDLFERECDEVAVTTEDGSDGTKGLVTEPLPALLADGGVDAAYACGPEPMLAAVAQVCRAQHVPCWVSMEQRMGCGIGACLSCVVPTRLQPKYQRVCADGPVFRASDILWEELVR